MPAKVLTKDQIDEMISLYRFHLPATYIAKLYNVTPATVTYHTKHVPKWEIPLESIIRAVKDVEIRLSTDTLM